jgi:hypothetical protein
MRPTDAQRLETMDSATTSQLGSDKREVRVTGRSLNTVSRSTIRRGIYCSSYHIADQETAAPGEERTLVKSLGKLTVKSSPLLIYISFSPQSWQATALSRRACQVGSQSNGNVCLIRPNLKSKYIQQSGFKHHIQAITPFPPFS